MRMFTRRLMVTAAVAIWLTPARASRTVKVYKAPGCGCCDGWASHMRAAGFAVSVTETPSLDRIRRDAGVPDAVAGCHTGFIDDLVIEGHAPAAAVEKLLSAPGRWRGIGVPGMPLGSPGMEVPDQAPEPYDVWAFARTGMPVRFARARGTELLPG